MHVHALTKNGQVSVNEGLFNKAAVDWINTGVVKTDTVLQALLK